VIDVDLRSTNPLLDVCGARNCHVPIVTLSPRPRVSVRVQLRRSSLPLVRYSAGLL
jgi:hypothetical protein